MERSFKWNEPRLEDTGDDLMPAFLMARIPPPETSIRVDHGDDDALHAALDDERAAGRRPFVRCATGLERHIECGALS